MSTTNLCFDDILPGSGKLVHTLFQNILKSVHPDHKIKSDVAELMEEYVMNFVCKLLETSKTIEKADLINVFESISTPDFANHVSKYVDDSNRRPVFPIKLIENLVVKFCGRDISMSETKLGHVDSIIDCLCGEIFEYAGNYAKSVKRMYITRDHIIGGIKDDDDLTKTMFNLGYIFPEPVTCKGIVAKGKHNERACDKKAKIDSDYCGYHGKKSKPMSKSPSKKQDPAAILDAAIQLLKTIDLNKHEDLLERVTTLRDLSAPKT